MLKINIIFFLLVSIFSVSPIMGNQLLLYNILLPSVNKIDLFQQNWENFNYVNGPIKEIELFRSDYYNGEKIKRRLNFDKKMRLLESASFSYETRENIIVYEYNEDVITSSYELTGDSSRKDLCNITYDFDDENFIVQNIYNRESYKLEIQKYLYDDNFVILKYNYGSTPITVKIIVNDKLITEIFIQYHNSENSLLPSEDRFLKKKFIYDEFKKLIRYKEIELVPGENERIEDMPENKVINEVTYTYIDGILSSAHNVMYNRARTVEREYIFNNLDELNNWQEMTIKSESGEITKYTRKLEYYK